MLFLCVSVYCHRVTTQLQLINIIIIIILLIYIYIYTYIYTRDFPPVQTVPGAHPASCKMGTGSFPGVKCGRGLLLTTHAI